MRKILLFICILWLFAAKTNAQITFFVENPSNLTGTYDFTYADISGGWGVDMSTAFALESLVIVDDGTTEDSLGCFSLVNGAQVSGKIAVIYRGSCEFGTKALNAQNAGAIAVIIINNGPGGPVGMAPGTDGGSVAIPVIMIGYDDGALFRSAIDAGTAVAFIGNKTGLYDHDLGLLSKQMVFPASATVPVTMADSNYAIPVQGWVKNYGINAQNNVTLSAQIIHGTDTIYDETSPMGQTLNSGDSVYLALPTFNQQSYDLGFYDFIYTTASDSVDGFEADNSISTHFWINDSLFYSKSRFDTITVEPIANGSIGYITGTEEFRSCIVLDIKESYGQSVKGLSFAAIRSEGPDMISLNGAYAVAELFEWNDIISPTSVTFSDLTILESSLYQYNANLQNEYVSVDFLDSVPLQDNSRYLACVYIDQVSNNHMRLSADRRLDYETTYDVYVNDQDDYSTLFPFEDITQTMQWYPYWSTQTAPAIIVNLIAGNIVANFNADLTTVCTGGTVNFTDASIGSVDTWNWDFGAGASPATATGVGPHSVSYSTTGDKTVSLVVSDVNGNDSIAKVDYISVIDIPVQPGAISGEVSVCDSTTHSYSIASVPDAASYTWTVPAGAIINSGQGTTSVSVTFETSSGDVCVSADNMCGVSTASCLSVTVSPASASPGTISGLSTICEDSLETYSISPVSGAIGYNWTVPSGWTINSGQGDTLITVTPDANGGSVCVSATLSCGTSNPECITVSVNTVPAAGAISGPSSVCDNTTEVYSISAVSGASYNWTVPSDWTISSGQGTTSITVSVGLSSGDVCVVASNSCGSGTPSCLAVTVNSIPPQPDPITGNDTICEASSDTWSTVTTPGASSYSWTLPAGWTGSSTSNSITASAGNTGGSISVSAENVCGSSPAQSLLVTVLDTNEVAITITTNKVGICAGDTVTFTSATVNSGSSPVYQWMVNGTNVGGNSDTYTTSNLSDGDLITCEMTADPSAGSCLYNNPATSNTIYMSVYPLPNQPEILQNGDELACNIQAAYYQWYLNGDAITGAQSQFYTAETDGFYSVVITDINGCSASSNLFQATGVGITEDMPGNDVFRVYPNPGNGLYTLEVDLKEKSIFKLSNILGQVLQQEEIYSRSRLIKNIDIQDLPSGVYHISISNNQQSFTKKLIKY